MSLKTCSSCNVFKFDDFYYQQLRGLAMVNDLSSLLAITYVDYIESHCITGDFILNKHRVNEAFVITCS